MKKIFFMALAISLAASAEAADSVFRSVTGRTRLIELYSSEGCSSCPPADAWISSLRTSRRLWKDFVPVVFHVTYWDHLGWKDPLADEAFTSRQYAYAASWGNKSVYTPGFVLDGAEWRGWGNEPASSDEAAGVLEARVRGNRVRVTFTHPAAKGPYDVYGARLGFGVSSHVTSGENAGLTLGHDFVTGGMTRAALKERKGSWTGEFPLPSAPRLKTKRTGLAVWIVGRDGRPIQATGGMLLP